MSTSCSEDHQMLSYTMRKTLQGPRPADLKVNKFSSGINVSKIKKPEMNHQNQYQREPRRRSPVVRYLVSPKVIHVRPEEFMGLVQRLTGKQAMSSSSSSACREKEKDNKSVISEAYNDSDNQCISSPAPSAGLASYSSLCIDSYSDWDEF